jgi:hypothetical protein
LGSVASSLEIKKEGTMKKQVHITLAMIILVSVLAVGVTAQTGNRQQLTVDIPFVFSVGKLNLPAGTYTLSILNPASDRAVLQLKNSEARLSAMVLTTNAIHRASDNATLTFRRYDDKYFFAQAWIAGQETGYAAAKSTAERKLQGHLAKSGKKNDMVAVIAH